MRLVQLRVRNESQDHILETLDESNADYVIAEEAAGNDSSIVYFPLPDGAVDEMLDRLRENGLEEDAFTIVTQIETATTPTLDELEGQYTQGPDDEVGLSHAELRTKSRELTPALSMFLLFATVSSIVAAAGLLLDSAIIIVGAMVISPFAGSSLSASVGAVIGDYESIADSFKSQLIGLVVAISGAIVAGLVFRYGSLVPSSLSIENIAQVGAFSTPALLTLTVAVFAGAAGGFALVTDLPVSLAGVAVAAAIVPAAAATGLGIVWTEPMLAVGALVLLLLNVILINGTAYVSLWAFGYRSASSGNVRELVSADLRTVAGSAAAVVVALVVVVVLVMTYQHFVFAQTANQSTDEVLADGEYAELELEQIEIGYSGITPAVGQEPNQITVVVGQFTDDDYPELSQALQERIDEETDREVSVQVQFVEYQETAPEE
jgi:uncharacterized hydrophobic protein (TIGR00341 family)